MSLQPEQCDNRRITKFVGRQLSDEELADFEQHLGTCETCREALTSQTADRETWQKAGLYLRDDESDLRPLSSLSCSPDSAVYGHLSVEQVLKTLSPTDDPQMLGRLDGYEISGVIGSGGMGVVLKGFDRSLNRVVALKVMASHLATSGAARKRFAREAQAAAAITHDNVIDIYSVSEANGLPYLVMPYARGPSLQKRIDEGGPLSLVEVLRIGRQISTGLAAAHEQGLVHRDIKPANILLNDGIERLVITDFGLARAVDDASVTRTGVIAGTPQYMSPEQARGEGVDARSDLFSLGSVLYTACTGHVPFRADSAYGILRRITDNEPRPIRESNPEIPNWVCQIIAKLHAKSPDERFQTATEVAELLKQCLAHVQTSNTPLPDCIRQISKPPFLRRTWQLVKLRHVVLGIAGLAIAFPIALHDEKSLPTSDSAASNSKGNNTSSSSDHSKIATATDKQYSKSETSWYDDEAPSPATIQRNARQLAEESRLFFSNSTPDNIETSKGSDQ